MSATVDLPPLGPAPCGSPVGKAVEEDRKTPREIGSRGGVLCENARYF